MTSPSHLSVGEMLERGMKPEELVGKTVWAVFWAGLPSKHIITVQVAGVEYLSILGGRIVNDDWSMLPAHCYLTARDAWLAAGELMGVEATP